MNSHERKNKIVTYLELSALKYDLSEVANKSCCGPMASRDVGAYMRIAQYGDGVQQ